MVEVVVDNQVVQVEVALKAIVEETHVVEAVEAAQLAMVVMAAQVVEVTQIPVVEAVEERNQVVVVVTRHIHLGMIVMDILEVKVAMVNLGL